MASQCPKCGRRWPYDGSYQGDNRCFGCGWRPEGSRPKVPTTNANSKNPNTAAIAEYVCAQCRAPGSTLVSKKLGGPDLGAIAGGAVVVVLGFLFVFLVGPFGVLAGLALIAGGVAGKSEDFCDGCGAKWQGFVEANPPGGRRNA